MDENVAVAGSSTYWARFGGQSSPCLMRNEHEIHVLSYRKLRPRFLGEVFLLCFSQHLCQLGISAIIGQDEDHLRIRLGIGARNRVQRHPPPSPRLQRENDRRDIARLGGSEQIAAHRRIGLRHPAIKIITKALAHK